MNRCKRDYCSKGHHPRWKAWTATYEMSHGAWAHGGNVCDYCNAKVEGIGGGSPDRAAYRRMCILRAAIVTYAAYAAEQALLKMYRDRLTYLRQAGSTKKHRHWEQGE